MRNIRRLVVNGMFLDTEPKQCCNAHLSYKGCSIIIDYEWYLHIYNDGINRNSIVPFEVYPYNNDIYLGYAKLDKDFGKVDLSDLISQLDKLFEKENK